MTNDNLNQEIPLDPGAWTEPTETFVGKLVTCARSDTDQSRGKDGRTFTESRGYPRALRTFKVVIERADAVWDNTDGTTSPAKEYMELNLEKFVDGRFIPMNLSKGNNKPTFTLEMWKKAGVSLAPDPTVNEGHYYVFTKLRSKMFGTVAAKGIIYPTQKLPDDYAYKGDIRHIASNTASLDDAASAVEAGSTEAATAATFDEGELAALLVGVKVDDTAAITAFIGEHKELPANVRLELVDGDIQKRLVEAGTLTVEKGVYATA